VNITLKNDSPKAVCLSPLSFAEDSITIRDDKGDTKSITAATTPTSGCDALAPGAAKTRAVTLNGFSRYQEQTGKVCYHYAFSDSSAANAAWQASGEICE
jgi:hypothetical protein